MNRESLLLFKIQLINQYRLNDFKKGSTGKSEKKSTGIIVGFTLVIVMFAGYSFALAYGLGYAGLPGLIPAYAVTATGIAALFFTILKTNGFLFGYRDYDLLMSLPVSTNTVIASRFLAIYCTNMVFTLAFMAPMGIGYAIWVKPGILFYLYWLIGMFAAPLIPTTVAVIVGALIMAFASRFKYAKVLSTLLSLLLMAVALIFSMSGGVIGQNLDDTADLARLGTVIHQEICRFYPLAGIFTKVFESNGFLWLILFTGLSLLVYQLFLGLLSLRYKAISTGINGHIKRADYKLSALNVASPLQALYRKELKRFFTSNIYVTNIGAGIIMTLLFSVALTIMGPEKLEAAMGMPGLTAILYRILPFLLGTMLALSCSAASALSLEGRNLWILQSSPLPVKAIFDSKILVNLTLTLPVCIISGFCLILRLQPGLTDGILLLAVPVSCSFFSAIWGMFINMKMPRYDWETEMYAVKQSSASMTGMLGGSAIILAAMGFTFLPLGVDYRILSCTIILIMWLAAFLLYRTICRIERL